MNYLIDTHILLWALFLPQRLPKKIKSILTDPKNTINVSLISLWEISLKYSLNKLKISQKALNLVPQSVEKMDFIFLSLQPEELVQFYQLPRLHKDPFDRLLVWQAIKNKLVFISLDKEMVDYSEFGLQVLGK